MVSVRALQSGLMDSLLTSVAELEAQVTDIIHDRKEEKELQKKDIVKLLTEFTVGRGEYVSQEYVRLFPLLVTRYHDNMVFSGLGSKSVDISRKFYTTEWLRAVGYFDDGKRSNPDAEILFQPAPTATTISAGVSYLTAILAVIYTGLISFFIGRFYKGAGVDISGGRGGVGSERHHYMPIHGVDAADGVELPFSCTLRA